MTCPLLPMTTFWLSSTLGVKCLKSNILVLGSLSNEILLVKKINLKILGVIAKQLSLHWAPIDRLRKFVFNH